MSNPVNIYALGGLQEVGKNCYCIENSDSLFIIDCGVLFPGSELPGIDYLVPDFTHLKNNSKKVKALFITHGHEDHIGGVPFLLMEVNIPRIYAPKLAAALIRKKLEDYHMETRTTIIEYDQNDCYEISGVTFSFFRVTHSIPDSFGIIIETSEGTIATTGDFKIDLTPVGPDIEIDKISAVGKEGIDLLLSDSTNAEQEGYTPSEKNVRDSVEEIFKNTKGRLIISTFSSNVSRIQQIVEAANNYNRKIVIVGRSMEAVIRIARSLGYIKIKDESIVPVEEIKNLKLEETLILCTGSQGEPMAALSRIAAGVFPEIKIIPGDTVVFSSSAIPGNGILINMVVNQLSKCGADVITNSILRDIHSSGHPSKQELRLMLKLFKPTYFMPVHGEYRMLVLHGKIAEELGIPNENVFILGNGDSITLVNHKISSSYQVPSGVTYIDGNGSSSVSPSIIGDRKQLEHDGMVGIIVFIDETNKVQIKKPEITSTGFVYVPSPKVIASFQEQIYNEVNDCLKEGVQYFEIKKRIARVSSIFLKKISDGNPMVVPLIVAK